MLGRAESSGITSKVGDLLGVRQKEDDHLQWLSVQHYGQIKAETLESCFWQVAGMKSPYSNIPI